MEMVNLGRQLFIDQTGEQYPIVAMFDCDGDECGPDDAVAAIAGTEGRWHVLDLAEFGCEAAS